MSGDPLGPESLPGQRSCWIKGWPMTMMASERTDNRNEQAKQTEATLWEPKKGCRLALGAVPSKNTHQALVQVTEHAIG